MGNKFNEFKPCTCVVNIPTEEYNEMVKYTRNLENFIKRCADNICNYCIGCEHEATFVGEDCENWQYNKG